MYLPTNRHFFSFFSFGSRCQQYSRIANIGQKHGGEPKQRHSRPYKHPGMQRNTRHNRAISACRTFCPETGPTRPARQPAPTARKSPGVRRLLTPPIPPQRLISRPTGAPCPASEYPAPPHRNAARDKAARQHSATAQRAGLRPERQRSSDEAAPGAATKQHPERRRQPHFPIRTPGTQ